MRAALEGERGIVADADTAVAATQAPLPGRPAVQHAASSDPAIPRSQSNIAAAYASERILEATESGDLRTVGTLRHHVVGVLRSWGLAPLADSAELLTSELVTNAVQHGGGCTSLRLSRDFNFVRIEVSHQQSGRPVARRAEADEERGRGLLLVEHVASAWGVSHDGTTVWFTIALPKESRHAERHRGRETDSIVHRVTQ